MKKEILSNGLTYTVSISQNIMVVKVQEKELAQLRLSSDLLPNLAKMGIEDPVSFILSKITPLKYMGCSDRFSQGEHPFIISYRTGRESYPHGLLCAPLYESEKMGELVYI